MISFVSWERAFNAQPLESLPLPLVGGVGGEDREGPPLGGAPAPRAAEGGGAGGQELGAHLLAVGLVGVAGSLRNVILMREIEVYVYFLPLPGGARGLPPVWRCSGRRRRKSGED